MPILGIIASSIQKAFASFSDTFNRTTSTSLGTSSSGGMWEALRGTFFANGSSAQSDDAATTYPMSFIKSASANSFTTFVPGNGGVLVASSGTVGSVASGNGTTGTSGFHWATVTVSSTTGVSVGDWIYATNGTGSLYGGTPDYVEVTSIVANTSITYRIKGGTVPTAGTVANIYTRGKTGGSGTSFWITDSGNWFGVVYGRGNGVNCNCSQCGNGTFSCTAYGASTGQDYSKTYSCTSTKYNVNIGASYGYRYAYTGSTSFMYARYDSYSSYCGSYSSQYNALGTWSFAGYVCTASTENTSECNCQTCYPPYISLIKSSSNAVSEIARWTLASMADKVKVIANSLTNVITIRPYKDKSMTNQIGSDLTNTLTTPTTTNKFGIIIAPSDQIQGKNLDDFTLGQN